MNQLSFISLLSCIVSAKSAVSSTDTTTFQVLARVGGNLGGAAERIGTYTFDKMHNNAAAFTNGNYFIFYDGDADGWQWVGAYNQWAGDGPSLVEITSAVDFTNYELFSSNVYPHDLSASSPPFNVIRGSASPTLSRLGTYTYDKEYNGVAAYTNGNYIIFYDGESDGWQWVGAYNQWAGNGPHPPEVPSAPAFVIYKGYGIETGHSTTTTTTISATTTSPATTTTTTCDSSMLGVNCEDDNGCPDCMQCCPKFKKCEYPPEAAKAILTNIVNKNKPQLPDIGVNPNYIGKDPNFIAPAVPKNSYDYGYIMLIGVVAFILINNIFIGYWCITRKTNDYKFEKLEMEVIHE